MIAVVVVDDQVLIRSAVRDLLDGEPDIEVVGEAKDGESAVEEVRRLRPDVVVMDIRMPRMDGIDATALICRDPALADTRVLVLTTFEEDEYVVAALRAGASGFVGKGAEPEEIGRAVRAVHAGDELLSPAATRALIATFVRSRPAAVAPRSLSALTDREREILVLVARGRSNDDIAAELFISPHTAKTHIKRMMTKLGAHDRAQLVIAAYESGLVAPGS